MAYRLWIDGTGPVPILHATPLDPPEQRSGSRGPFTDRALFEQLCALVLARCHAAGCQSPVGRSRNAWHLNVQIPRRDARILIAAPRAWLEDGDEQPLRSYVRSPPDLRARPGLGDSWAA